MAQGGLINAAYDAADNIKRMQEQKNRKDKAKALAKKKAAESVGMKDNFSLF